MSKIEVDTIDTQSSTTLQVGSTNTSLIKIGTSGDTVEYPAGTTFTQSGTQNVTSGGAINVKSGGNITIDSGATITNNGTASGFSADLTNLNATNLTSGTVPDARFPATLPAANGSALTNLNATTLTSGTIPAARISSLPAGVGGKILQVVQGTSNTAFTQSSPDNSTRYFPSSNKITASITPSATSSKIIVQFQTTIKMESSSSDMGSAMCVKESISGGSTTIIESSGDAYGSGLYFASTVSSNVRSRLFESILRTPNTTSAITYEVGLMSYELTSIELNNNSSTGIITLMEVAG